MTCARHPWHHVYANPILVCVSSVRGEVCTILRQIEDAALYMIIGLIRDGSLSVILTLYVCTLISFRVCSLKMGMGYWGVGGIKHFLTIKKSKNYTGNNTIFVLEW